MKLVIVSGLSGSGKTVALHTLEDEQFYCIDNLHVGLLPALVEQLNRPGYKLYDKAAVGIDARSGASDLQQFPRILDEVRTSALEVQIIFLQAEVQTLIRRFSETRRRHPLTRNGVPLMEAIDMERALLADIAADADLKLDTTATNVHQLRNVIRERVRTDGRGGLSLLFQSFGYKHGVPSDSDYVFDCRCLPNPHWEPTLRELSGQDPEVVEYLQQYDDVEAMFASLRDFLAAWIPKFQADNRSYLTVSLGCTGGRHRSVYLADRLSAHFRGVLDSPVSTRHQEVG